MTTTENNSEITSFSSTALLNRKENSTAEDNSRARSIIRESNADVSKKDYPVSVDIVEKEPNKGEERSSATSSEMSTQLDQPPPTDQTKLQDKVASMPRRSNKLPTALSKNVNNQLGKQQNKSDNARLTPSSKNKIVAATSTQPKPGITEKR
jgi:hypothetical protein